MCRTNFHKTCRKLLFAGLLPWCGILPGNAQEEVGKYKGLRMNEVQVIGSHNSYKPGIHPAIFNMLSRVDSGRAA
ncbi:MAG TPA: Ca2+-dependent phosphoinositide-specific phospholipase C, partial [Phnomibacter sp.]|nr:Ca2+-dependent phosphoinositide-specific phospholipase C [Phnomibacter sp.]